MRTSLCQNYIQYRIMTARCQWRAMGRAVDHKMAKAGSIDLDSIGQ